MLIVKSNYCCYYYFLHVMDSQIYVRIVEKVSPELNNKKIKKNPIRLDSRKNPGFR